MLRARAETERDGRRGPGPLGEPVAGGPADSLVALQRAAGNRAVGAVVQRQDAGGFTFSPIAPRPPDLNLRPDSRLGAAAPRLSEEVAGKVRAYLEGRRYEIGSRVSDGAISMPEVVQAVRENVPEAVAYLEGRRYEIGSRVSDGAISMPEVVQAVRENVPEAASAPVADIEGEVAPASAR